MTAFTLFGEQLFVLYTSVGHAGLVLACWAAAAVALAVRQRTWGARSPAIQSFAAKLGLLTAGVAGLTLAAGFRVGGTAYAPAEPMFWETITALLSSLGMVATAYAVGSGVAAAAKGELPAGAPVAALAELDPVESAVAAWERLAAATRRLRASESDAAARAGTVTDSVAAAEYTKAADAIRHRLRLAEELEASTAAAVLRLACGSKVRRVLERRPDDTLKALNDKAAKAPLAARVDTALAAVRAFLKDLEAAQAALQREQDGAPGSVAKRLGLDAKERARPFAAALLEIGATYGRVAHRLEALRLRLAADADAGAVASAAMAVTGEAPRPPQDVVEVAMEMTQADQSAAAALLALGAEPARIADVVVHASAALARGDGDDEAMADVLRVVRREMER
jgi:hypothetical protein